MATSRQVSEACAVILTEFVLRVSTQLILLPLLTLLCGRSPRLVAFEWLMKSRYIVHLFFYFIRMADEIEVSCTCVYRETCTESTRVREC